MKSGMLERNSNSENHSDLHYMQKAGIIISFHFSKQNFSQQNSPICEFMYFEIVT